MWEEIPKTQGISRWIVEKVSCEIVELNLKSITKGLSNSIAIVIFKEIAELILKEDDELIFNIFTKELTKWSPKELLIRFQWDWTDYITGVITQVLNRAKNQGTLSDQL